MLTTNNVLDQRRQLIADHVATPYYEAAEANDVVAIFWGDNSLFLPLFDKLDKTAVLELACGHGRHSAKVYSQIGQLTLVDAVEENIAACRNRFSGSTRFVANNGSDLFSVPDQSQTAVFSYDAMVHFEFADTLGYLPEISRVLKPGGRALLHYSVNDATPGSNYRDCPRWRNFGSEKVFLHFALRAGLTPLEHFTTSWPPRNGEAAIDGVALLEKR
jgi:SAM-dependent methyltransferase